MTKDLDDCFVESMIADSINLSNQVAEYARTAEVQRASEVRVDVFNSLNQILEVAGAILINHNDNNVQHELVDTLREHVGEIRKRMDIG
tara:strand:+ start:1512 stop:1778 length:267 start_codon:yes stop_codon:yes gene_type:complete